MRHVRKKFRFPRNCAVETRLAGLLLLTILRTASAGILEQSVGSRNRVVVPARSLYILVGRYDNPTHSRFRSPIDCSKIPALGLPFASSDPYERDCTSSQQVEIRAEDSKPKRIPNYHYMYLCVSRLMEAAEEGLEMSL
jgi:hypothetical protein